MIVRFLYQNIGSSAFLVPVAGFYLKYYITSVVNISLSLHSQLEPAHAEYSPIGSHPENVYWTRMRYDMRHVHIQPYIYPNKPQLNFYVLSRLCLSPRSSQPTLTQQASSQPPLHPNQPTVPLVKSRCKRAEIPIPSPAFPAIDVLCRMQATSSTRC